MELKSIKYVEHSGSQKEWKLYEFSPGQINLIVGKNAVGKSRTLSLINGLANLLSEKVKMQFTSGNYTVRFSKQDECIEYYLKYEDNTVVQERLKIGKKEMLTRTRSGSGEIYASKVGGGKKIGFKVQKNQLAVVAKRDGLQHPFLENLHLWGEEIRYYRFGTEFGSHLTKFANSQQTVDSAELEDPNEVVSVFQVGKKKYPNIFDQTVVADMASIGYNISEIGLKTLDFGPQAPQDIQCLYVKEKDLRVEILQNKMSPGMFRALSLIIRLSYAQLKKGRGCTLIDDIGEGLDYERSTALIKIVIDKVKKSNGQLIMATNDRFIMNNVPLEYWSVMDREGGTVKIYNKDNAKKAFSNFEVSGLSNFDFFTSKRYLGASHKK